MNILKKNKSLSKKIIAIVIGSTVLIAGGGYIYTENIKSKEINTEMVSREREYLVERDDIVAGINGSGKIKFNQVTQSFEEPVTIGEVFVKVGHRISKGDKIASISTEEINEQLKELNNQLKEMNKEDMGVDEKTKNEIKKQIAKLEKIKKSPILYSKASGIVFDVGYAKGEETSKEKHVITIAEDGDVLAEIPVSQDNILNIEVGQQVYVWVSAYEGEKFSGKVDFINLKPNSENGTTTFPVTVKLDETSNELLDGMSISSQFILKELKDVLTLSNKAIILKDGKQIVKVRQEDGTLKEKEITTGFSDGKKSEIIDGLKEGDTVVVGGQ